MLVGSGESKQEFKCYKVILSFASKYFDDMFSSGMNEDEDATGKVQFPDSDPEGWKHSTSLSLGKLNMIMLQRSNIEHV